MIIIISITIKSNIININSHNNHFSKCACKYEFNDDYNYYDTARNIENKK